MDGLPKGVGRDVSSPRDDGWEAFGGDEILSKMSDKVSVPSVEARPPERPGVERLLDTLSARLVPPHEMAGLLTIFMMLSQAVELTRPASSSGSRVDSINLMPRRLLP